MREFICGKNTVLDGIKNNLPIKVVYTTRPETKELSGVRVEKVSKEYLDKVTRENHQGYVAVLKEFNYYDLNTVINDKPEKILILDHVQDPHNLGAIMRSANAFGVKHIIIPKNRAAKVTPSALKVSSGGYVGLKVVRVNSIMDAIQKLKDAGVWIYSSALEGGTNIEQVTFNYPMAMIVGNEEKGVSRALLKHSDQIVYVNMTGTVQSLNVSVAAGIILSRI